MSALARQFGFDAVESGGIIRFVTRGQRAVAVIAPDDMVGTPTAVAASGDVMESGAFGSLSLAKRRSLCCITPSGGSIMAKHWTPINYAAINYLCLQRFTYLVQIWLPNGRLDGQEWVALNPTLHDNKAGSFKVNTITGKWADFATNDKGGDPISLYAYLNNLSQKNAALELQRKLGGSHG